MTVTVIKKRPGTLDDAAKEERKNVIKSLTDSRNEKWQKVNEMPLLDEML